jgi:flavin reductase (DIM6/NTAB) family NADH-FMN oxidoreductase RutF
VFVVNFLADDHEHLSRHFAVSGGDKFGDLPTLKGVTGVPVLRDALAHLECRAVNIIDAGDHTIFIGEVESADAREGEPLLYFRGAYHRVAKQ